jgi:hypothetical protein
MTAAARSIAAALLLAAALPAQTIVGGTATDDFRPVDSGVQITGSWVLTARHVGYAQGGTYSNGWGSATIAARYDLGTGPELVNDLALLRLTSPIATAPTLDLLGDPLPVGPLATPLAVTIATGSNQVPRGYAFAALAEVIDQIELEVNKVVGNYDVNWLLAYNDTHSAPYVEHLDSGGGLFLGHVADSSGAVLMGISSAQWQFTPAEGGGFGSGFVQLAAYRGWIDTTMANDPADSQFAHWVSVVPEPATWALWLAAAALMAGMVRRRRMPT